MKNKYPSLDFDQLLSQSKPGRLLFGGARMAMLDIRAGFWGLRRQIEALIGSRLTNSVLQQAGANGGASFASSFIQEEPKENFTKALADCLMAYQAAGFGTFRIENVEPFCDNETKVGRVIIHANDTFESWAAHQEGKKHRDPICAYSAGVLVGFVNVLAGRSDIVCVERSCQILGEDVCHFELIPVAVSDRQVDEIVSVNPDPALTRRVNLLEILFDRMPMGIVLLDTDLKIRRFNPTWTEFVNRYRPPDAQPVVPGDVFIDLAPGLESTVKPIFDQVLSGETIYQDAYRLEAEGVISYWDAVNTPLFENGDISGILQVITDVTERVKAEQALKEQQRMLSTLISNLSGMAYRCRNDQAWTMEFVSQGSLALTGYRPEDLIDNRVTSYGDLIHPEDRQAIQKDTQIALEERRPFELTYRLNTPLGEKWVWEQGQGVFNEIGEVIALEGFITDITERVMAQRHLEQRVEERTRELSSLLDIAHNLASTLDLEELLDLILDQLRSVVDYDAASIMILEEGLLKILAYRGPIPREEALDIQFSLEEARTNREVILGQKPLIIADVWSEESLARGIRESAGEAMDTTYSYLNCWMGVPLMVKNQVIGMLTLDHREPGHYRDSHANFAMAFANQAAVAIENTRLYQVTERRVEENESLFAVQQAITSRLEMDEVLQMISDEARRLTNTDISAVYLLEGDELEISYVSGIVSETIVGYRLSIADSIAGQVVKERKAILIPDTWEDSRVDRKAADQVGARSLLIVPLVAGEKTIGTITVANRTPGGFTPEDERLLTRLAGNVVISVENARLYQAEQNRRLVAESLRDIIGMINSDVDLDTFLDQAVMMAAQRLGASGCVLHKFDMENEIIIHRASYGLEGIFEKGGKRGFQDLEVSGGIKYLQATLQHQPTYTNYPPLPDRIEEVRNSELIPPKIKKERIALRQKYAGSFSVPLFIRDEVYGGLVFYYTDPQNFSEEQIQLGMTFTDQVAVAIENAHLFEKAEESAIAAERDRLARDLHDAVTQTLFSTSLIAEVLPTIWEKDPDQGRARLEEIRTLTRGALAEMRSLLMELRPSALMETPLPDLLKQLTEAFTGRSGVPVTLTLEGECEFSPDVKVAIYRVAQESLNNVAKHANASQCWVDVTCWEEGVSLMVADDGQGFDTDQISPDSLGVGIMRERADQINAQLEIDSTIDTGTQIRMTWRANNKENV